MNKGNKAELAPAQSRYRDNERKELEAKIAAGIILRENGRMEEAELVFEEAERLAQTMKLYDRWVNIKLARYLIFLHKWKNNHSPADLEEMHRIAQMAKKLVDEHKLSGQARALALMRFGQWQLESGRPADAVKSFRNAVAELKNSALSDEPEYLGILGSALVYTGDQQKLLEGLQILIAANGIVKAMAREESLGVNSKLLDWNFRIIRTGIWLRLAEAYSLFGKNSIAESYMREAKIEADWLASIENMPQRQNDWYALRRKIDQRPKALNQSV
jgi:tetratricopeptide (TPR) repeat protein